MRTDGQDNTVSSSSHSGSEPVVVGGKEEGANNLRNADFY